VSLPIERNCVTIALHQSQVQKISMLSLNQGTTLKTQPSNSDLTVNLSLNCRTALAITTFLLLILLLCSCTNQLPLYNSNPIKNTNTLNPHYVTTRQGQIEYYRFGKGTPIILIPGYVTDVTSWDRDFLLTLAQHHDVIILNNRNVGGSITHSSHYESSDLAHDIDRLIKTLQLKKPAILGISMGGMIAQAVVIHYANDIGQLILINTLIAGNKAVHPNPEIEKSLYNMPTDKLHRYFMAIHLFFPPNWQVRMGYKLATNRFLPAHYTEVNPAAIIPAQRHFIVNWLHDNTAARKIAKLRMPVLILNGKADIIIPPVNSVILAHTIPKAILLRWQEGGHAMIYQFPEEIGNAINNFLLTSSTIGPSHPLTGDNHHYETTSQHTP
jgi:pimeloyl-ACP methyl ester carboxylesterase